MIDYYSHKIYTPPYNNHQFENDIKQKENDDYLETAKRAALISLPFLSLYQPLATIISYTMGTMRIITHGSIGLFSTEEAQCVSEMMQTSLAVFALASMAFNFTFGLFATTCADLITNLYHIPQELQEGKYEELLQALGSTLYLAIMLTGSLEVILASLLIQVVINIYQSRNEWENNRIPEAIAKLLMGSIRLYQGHNQWKLIEKRNEFLSSKEHKLFIDRVQGGRKIDHLYDHPLVNLPKKIAENRVILTDAEGNEYDFGAHFFGYGKQPVKGMNISFRETKNGTKLDFKVNHVFRDRLEQLIEETKSFSHQDIQDILSIFGAHTADISFKQIDFNFPDHGIIGPGYQIDVAGLGSILIGSSKNLPNMYDRVSVQMQTGKTLYDFHEVLSYFSLDDVLRESAKEDIDRMKMGQLFRIFFPREATLFERTEEFFDLPIEQFREEICKKAPMESIFTNYLDRMELREMLPGKLRYGIKGLADEIRSLGGKELSAAVTGAWDSDEEIFKRTVSILKMGMMSSELRKQYGLNVSGLSSTADFYTGGADSVFTQMVTDLDPSHSHLAYQGQIRILFSLDALETGSYQYLYDAFGTRQVDDSWWFDHHTYLNRPDIKKFTHNLHLLCGDHEIMIKERIPPSLISGVLVESDEMKIEFLDYLRKTRLISSDEFGKEWILGKPVDQFIKTEDPSNDDFFTWLVSQETKFDQWRDFLNWLLTRNFFAQIKFS